MTGELWLLIGFFAFVMGVVTAVGYLFLRPAPQPEAGEVAVLAPETGAASDVVLEVFRWMGQLMPLSEKEAGGLRKRLASAGYRSPATVPLFCGLRCASALLVALVLGWSVFLAQNNASATLLPAAAALAFGYTLPDRILRSMIKRRLDRIRRALPDALDLMVLCVEAGQSLDQGLIDSSAELRGTYPDLSTELALAHLELRAGIARAAALRNLADRNPDPEVRKFVNLLIQSDRFGTSLGPALRVHAKYLRLRFKQQAEEAARKISVKLLFPIFFLIFPCMLMVTAGPAILQIFTQLLPMIEGSGR